MFRIGEMWAIGEGGCIGIMGGKEGLGTGEGKQ